MFDRSHAPRGNAQHQLYATKITMTNLNEHISIDPNIRSGKPCIRSTRITVYDILEYMASGMSETEILHDFPSLKPEHLISVLSFAAQRERRLTISIFNEITI